MIIELPFPPKELNPNSRTHWRKKNDKAQKYKSDAYLLAKGTKPVWSERLVDLHIEFVPPDNRRRDMDNMLAAIKAGLDGIAKAWGVDDCKFRLTLEIGSPQAPGAVIIRNG